MKIVVDTNILFSFFWKSSITKKLIISSNLNLISPEIALEEIKKYKREIMKKVKINNEEFKTLFNELKLIINFVEDKEYNSFLKKAEIISPDKNDAKFFALCLKYDYPLWTNDKLLKNQEMVSVVTTEDLIDVLFE